MIELSCLVVGPSEGLFLRVEDWMLNVQSPFHAEHNHVTTHDHCGARVSGAQSTLLQILRRSAGQSVGEHARR